MTNAQATQPGFTETMRRLAGAQKPPAKGSPAYSRFVNRKIGRVLAAAAFQLRLTPNQVTFISAASVWSNPVVPVDSLSGQFDDGLLAATELA